LTNLSSQECGAFLGHSVEWVG